MKRANTFLEVVSGLEAYLEFERDEGMRTLEVEAAVLQALVHEEEPYPVVAPVKTPAVKEAAVREVTTPEATTVEMLAEQIVQCRKCVLCNERTHAVPGEGCADAPDILFVGEGPGADEDEQGRPFVGRAGALLTKMIEAMGYDREEVFIANVVKCRPPGNRTPLPEEMEACLPYLKRQIELIRPRVIIALGATAVKGLLGKRSGITRLRGVWQEFEGIKVMPTFHPSYLLRDPSKKKDVWQDLQKVLAALGKNPPAAGK